MEARNENREINKVSLEVLEDISKNTKNSLKDISEWSFRINRSFTLKTYKKIGLLLLVLVIFLIPNLDFFWEDDTLSQDADINKVEVMEDGNYSSSNEVVMYLFQYEKLPPNYITKEEAENLGWKSHEGNLWEVTDKKSIGGNRFYNREGNLPEKAGRLWFECDINYQGSYRGSERLIYSNDGLVYYTKDHYETFTEIKQEKLIK